MTTEVRWHARAGQGAKTAAQLLALALLRSGQSVQAFPEYGPERRGAPMRAYTRVSDTPIRRHDAVVQPDVVVVLEPSLLAEQNVTEGLAPGGRVLVVGEDVHVSGNANVAMAAAVAALIGAPRDHVRLAAHALLGRKVPAEELDAAVAEGYACPR